MCALRRDDHIAPFDDACVAGVADLHDDLWGIDIGEVRSGGHDDGVGFADDLGAFGDEERFGHFVSASVDEDDLAGGSGGVDGVLESGCVVRCAVALCAPGPYAAEGGRGEVVVLWF